ncbi:hypothetical protein P2Q59_04635, partial [Escherichia coli]
DRNRSHWSTSKTPSYTKSVSWQHHPQPHAQKFNVRGTDGASKAIYALPSNQVVPSTWTFYARMQKVNNALAPVAGIVRSQVIVNVYYE